MKKAYEEVKLAVVNERNYLSKETLELCLEALRIIEEQKHNGYTNYPTWLVASHIDNNEKLYNTYWNLVNEMWDAREDDYNVIGILRQTIEADFSTECMKYQLKCDDTIWSSMLNHCNKDLINYYEIAKTFIE